MKGLRSKRHREWLAGCIAAGCLTLGCPVGDAAAHMRPALSVIDDFGPLVLAAAPDEPEGYRMGDYRSPVPATLSGATVLRTEVVLEMWDARSAKFIDVLPQPPKPTNLAEGTVWRPPERFNIPGSVWLANVGFGKINPQIEDYFRTNLEKISGGDTGMPLVFYCLANCWMSWNAAKRALGYGYTNVYWYPDGTDGWAIAGGNLERSEPVPAVD